MSSLGYSEDTCESPFKNWPFPGKEREDPRRKDLMGIFLVLATGAR